ncbi:MAG: peptidase MA family metallohydrolase [Elusimicrobiales bacterium]|nr:peptidase MA family metallohydrolase [Elusimicrobiales bacterium]
MYFLILKLVMINLLSENWHRIESKNFEIYIEGKWQVQSIQLELEKIYSLVKMNLSHFSPWMLREKTKVYIFKTYETYLKSEFKPPPWSKGLCFHKQRKIVVYYKNTLEELLSTIVHELSHLYYEDFFLRKMKSPPLWLNEGLAVYMESLYKGFESQWDKSLISVPDYKIINFSDFVKKDLKQLKSDEEIAFWYLQAFGMVKYLYYNFGKTAFYRFNMEILNNTNIEKSLWNIYRINSLETFEKKWFEWLYTIKKSQSFEFKPFKNIEFKNFN